MTEAAIALEQRVGVRLAVGRQPLDRDRTDHAAQHPCQLVERRIVLLECLVALLGFGEFGDVAVAEIEIVLLGRRRVCGGGEGEQAEQGERSHCDVRKAKSDLQSLWRRRARRFIPRGVPCSAENESFTMAWR